MPFTLAHPAAVWPLKRIRAFAVIPLVVGSLTPDLASYLPNAHALINSHSVRGTVILDLPLGYALLLLLVGLRNMMVTPLWQPHRRFISDAFSKYASASLWWLQALPSLLIDSWTHIVWDSFTHENHFMVRRLPILRQTMSIDGDHPVYLYRILQYGCSLLGMAVVIWWYVHALRSSASATKTDASGKSRMYWIIFIAAAALITGLVNALFIPPEWRSVYGFISVILTTAMPVFASAYLLTAAVLWQYEHRQAVLDGSS